MPRNFQNRQKSSDIFRLKISLCTQPLLSPGRNVSFALTVFRRSQKHAVTCKHFQGDPAEKCQLEEVCECGGCRHGQDSKCPHLNKHALCTHACACACVCVCVCVCVCGAGGGGQGHSDLCKWGKVTGCYRKNARWGLPRRSSV